MNKHLSEDELAAETVNRDLEPSRAEHLAHCEECRSALERRRENERLFRELADVAAGGQAVPMALLTRTAIPGYELVGEIHNGGQGTVYKARQVSTNRRVALKVLSRGDHTTSADLRRFEREIELACRLRHPNIVCVFASGRAGERLWYAMEFVDGERLNEYLEHHALDLHERLALIEEIAAAVAHAHRSGVIHRDLKPANILVDSNGTPRVVDFGLALSAAGDGCGRLTATGAFLGTLAYASPEQARGGDVVTRTDVHALGILLYETLTGHLPWDTSGSVADVLERIQHDAPLDPRSSAGEGHVKIDGELWTVLSKALAKDAAERYDSADALIRDLERYRAGEPLEARPHRLSYVLRKAFVRHRLGVLLAASMLLVVVSATALVVRERWRAETQRQQARVARELIKAVAGARGGASTESDSTHLAVLADSIERLDDELDESQDVRAALLLSLGESYAARLLNAEAEVQLRSAITRFREAGDESGRARALEGLAAILCQRGDSEAVALADEALRLRRDEHPPDDTRIAIGERLLARTLIRRIPEQDGDDGRALELIDRAEADLRALLGDQDPEVAVTLVVRAHLDGPNEATVNLYARALAVLERRPGEARRTVECLDGFANSLAAMGRYDEADVLLRRSVQLTRQTYGERHTVNLLRRRAQLERIAGNLVVSERLERSALATEVSGWVEDYETDAPARGEPGELGDLAMRLRDATPAPYSEAFQRLRELRGNGDFELSSWMNTLSLLLTDLERHTEAEAVLRESLEIHCRAFGLSCPNRQAALFLLAEQLVALERSEEASDCLDELIARAHETGTDDGRYVLRAGDLLRRLRPDATEELQ